LKPRDSDSLLCQTEMFASSPRRISRAPIDSKIQIPARCPYQTYLLLIVNVDVMHSSTVRKDALDGVREGLAILRYDPP